MTFKELHILLAPYWRPYSRRLICGLTCLVLSSSLIMLQPWIMKLAVDDLGKPDFTERIWIYASSILVVTILVCSFRFLMRWLIIGVSRNVEHDMRRKIFSHVMMLPKPFLDNNPTGDIMSRMTNDILKVRMILGPALMQIGNTLVSLVFALSFMLIIDVRLTILSLIPLPLMPVVFYLMGKKIRIFSELVQEQIADITSFVQETMTGIRIVKAYNLEMLQSELFDEMSNRYVKRNLDLVRFQGLFSPLMTLLTGISTCVILLFSGLWVITGKISIGSMVAFLEYLAILSWPLFAIGWVTGLIQQGSAAMQRIQFILSEPPCLGMLPHGHSQQPQDLRGDICFKDVCFRYNDAQQPVLKNLNFSIRSGETIAIMGPSGSGKSTILNLITRTYLPSSGVVSLNGHPINGIPEYDIRETVGIMPQNIILFSDSIANNLKFGAREPSSKNLHEAIEMAQLDPEISEFPEQIETILGERGVNLSGGQKQRLTLARMLLRNSQIVLLDDPFSSIDIVTEEAIMERLPDFFRDKTTIIVSHRMKTARRADRILVLNHGMICEQGTHESLIATDGYYADICRRQTLLEQLETF